MKPLIDAIALMVLTDDTGFQEAPSLLNIEGPSSDNHWYGRLNKTDAIREWIIMHTRGDSAHRKQENSPFLCLEALLTLHMSTSLSHTLCLTTRYGPLGPFNDFGSDMDGNVDHTRMSWEGLQYEIQTRRETLLALPDFVGSALDLADQTSDVQQAYDRISNRYERHVQCLELSANRLKETLDIKSSAKNIAMGKVTIKESKRLMLCRCSLSDE